MGRRGGPALGITLSNASSAYTNASSAYTEFRADTRQLHEINWGPVAATDFRNSEINEGKQAEFLMRDFFPWMLIRRIGSLFDGSVSRYPRNRWHRAALVQFERKSLWK